MPVTVTDTQRRVLEAVRAGDDTAALVARRVRTDTDTASLILYDLASRGCVAHDLGWRLLPKGARALA